MATEKKAAAPKAGTILEIGNYRVKASFSTELRDCTPGAIEVLGSKKKDTGVWVRIRLNDKQVLLIDAGEMAAHHNDGRANIFVEPTVEENSTAALRADLKIGVAAGQVIYN